MNTNIELLHNFFLEAKSVDLEKYKEHRDKYQIVTFYLLCRFFINSGKSNIKASEIRQYTIKYLEENGIHLDPQLQWNPQGFFAKGWSEKMGSSKIRSSGKFFRKEWTHFLDRSPKTPYTYYLNENHREDISKALYISGCSDNEREVDEEDLELSKVQNSSILSETEREAIVKSRIGQGRFRSDLMIFWDFQCSVTGLPFFKILKASHIKPWRDSDNHERLDPFNGLLLSPNLDALFDSFLISFDFEGKIMISKSIGYDNYESLGIDSEMKLSKLDEKHQIYLEYHRRRFFYKSSS